MRRDGMRLDILSPLLGDFADTAAAIMALDLVITVDTSVAHLAGALGKPVWILNPTLPIGAGWRSAATARGIRRRSFSARTRRGAGRRSLPTCRGAASFAAGNLAGGDQVKISRIA